MWFTLEPITVADIAELYHNLAVANCVINCEMIDIMSRRGEDIEEDLRSQAAYS